MVSGCFSTPAVANDVIARTAAATRPAAGPRTLPAVSFTMRLGVPTPAGVRSAQVYGSQLQDASIAGHAAEGHVELSYRAVPVRLADGQTVTVLKPRVRVVNLAYGPLARAVRLSPRVAPAMIGFGYWSKLAPPTLSPPATPSTKMTTDFQGGHTG